MNRPGPSLKIKAGRRTVLRPFRECKGKGRDIVAAPQKAYIDGMHDKAQRDAALQALLDFHVEAGVDLALDETPHDRFAERKEPGRTEETPRPPAPEMPHRGAEMPRRGAEMPRRANGAPPAAPAPPAARVLPRAAAGAPDDAAGMAREQARQAASLQELEAILASFEGCALKFSAKNLAFADGNPEGRVMLVGEAPGADEDRIGKPFMGRSGQLLDRMLAAIELDRSQIYIANIVPWRPPGNRTPTPQEVAICRPFIERQIELANPDILVCLGGPATQNLLHVKDGILKTRGRWFPYALPEREIKALATLHPAYLLRQPLQKRLAWRDFQALRRALDGRA